MYTLNDFFCGCGGLGLGFQNAGFKIVGAWDFDKYAGVGLQTSTAGTGKGRRMYEYRERESNGRKGYRK